MGSNDKQAWWGTAKDAQRAFAGEEEKNARLREEIKGLYGRCTIPEELQSRFEQLLDRVEQGTLHTGQLEPLVRLFKDIVQMQRDVENSLAGCLRISEPEEPKKN